MKAFTNVIEWDHKDLNVRLPPGQDNDKKSAVFLISEVRTLYCIYDNNPCVNFIKVFNVCYHCDPIYIYIYKSSIILFHELLKKMLDLVRNTSSFIFSELFTFIPGYSETFQCNFYFLCTCNVYDSIYWTLH